MDVVDEPKVVDQLAEAHVKKVVAEAHFGMVFQCLPFVFPEIKQNLDFFLLDCVKKTSLLISLCLIE